MRYRREPGDSPRDPVPGPAPDPAPGPAEPPVSDRVLTVPNLLSVLRLVGVPLLLWLLLVRKADGWAFALLLVSGFTDWADGKIARLLDQSSRLGALLDPLVDRLYLVATLVGLAIRDIVPWWVAALLIGRDVVLSLTLGVYRRRGLPPPEVIYLGKAATFALMAALPWMLAGEANWPLAGFGRAFGGALLWWGTAVYLWTGILYLGKALAVTRTVPVRRAGGTTVGSADTVACDNGVDRAAGPAAGDAAAGPVGRAAAAEPPTHRRPPAEEGE